ncbi:MAG: hypothetical protein ABW068_05950 [Candidatus Thiodiazotropha sp.]
MRYTVLFDRYNKQTGRSARVPLSRACGDALTANYSNGSKSQVWKMQVRHAG